MNLEIKENNTGVVFAVKVAAGSSRTRVAGLYNSALKINIAAAPEKDKANKELIKLLANLLQMPKSAVTIITGRHKNHKEIHLAQITAAQLRQALAPYGK